MRYYTIVINDQNGNLVTTPSSVPGSGATYTSAIGPDTTIPGALNVELDIPLAAYATPMGSAFIRIWGISVAEISAATKLNPKYNADGTATYFDIKVYGGMRKGLPLANPARSGLLVRGSIQQALGNWLGTDMTLDLIVAPNFGTNAFPKNISFDWKANTPLSDAISTSLTTAFPQFKQSINISDRLVLASDQPGFYKTIEQFAGYIKGISANIIGGNYPGVNIFLDNGTFKVDDQTASQPFKQIEYQDLIGQPTWIDGPTIQFKCSLRADISIGSYVVMPKNGAIVQSGAAASNSLVNLALAFKGQFYVSQIRHVGNFRQPDAAAWVTTFNASPLNQQPAGAPQ